MYKKLSILIISSAILFSTNGCAAVAIGAVAVVAGTTAYVVTDARKTGTVVDDNTIATKLQSKISDNYPKANIYVTCYNGVVLLTGQTDDKKSKDNIAFEAKTVPGVRQVYNYVDIRLSQGFTAETTDAYTTTQVKSKLLGLSGVDSNKVKVVTTNSVVYLLGIVSKKQAKKIADATASIGGVTRVITLFEYTS